MRISSEMLIRRAIAELRIEGETVDGVAVARLLDRKGLLVKAGGRAAVCIYFQNHPGAAPR